jgi:hypothetical protein
MYVQLIFMEHKIKMSSSSVAHEATADRHDNDKKNISQIAIIPTESEIRSERPEYLPSPLHFSQHSSQGIECIYDTFFRLHRHDAFAEVKRTIKNLLLEYSAGDKRRSNITNQMNHQNVRAWIYSGATVTRFRRSRKYGLEAQIRFQAPAVLQQKTVSQRRQWWNATKRLEEGVLLCLITLCEGKSTPMFFTVAEKDINSQNGYSLITENGPVISGALTTPMTIHNLMALTTSFQRPNGLLVEFPGVIPATFAPVLENLQEVLVNRRSRLLKWLLQPSSGYSSSSMPPPAYARIPGFTFDLSPVAINSTTSLAFEPGANTTRIGDNLKHLTTLDEGQCEALLASLSREFALIQGPPGTGKSYVGTQLVRVLLANKVKTALGPIIVVCHTNHALDQFLEHLITAGVDDIVRIGGNGTSGLLESRNLRTISSQSFKSRAEVHELSLAFKAKKLGEHVLLNQLKSVSRNQKLDWHSVRDHLHRKHNGIYEQFLFRARSKSNKGSRLAPFDLWLAGCEEDFVELKKPSISCKLEKILAIAEGSVYHLALEDRSALVDHWADEIRDELLRDMSNSLRDINESRATISLVHGEVDRRVLSTADVIGLTTTGLAKNASVLRSIGAKVVVCEEAAEVLEAHMLGTFLPSVQHLILIGDHEQLRPQIKNYDLFSIDSTQGKRYQLDRSLFERLVGQSTGQHQIPITQLNIQRRMRPEISRLVRHTLYPRLVDHPDTKFLPNVPGMRKNLFWYHHSNPEASAQRDTEGKSHSNDFEVQMTSALVHHIVRQGAYKSSEIVILTPYAGQLRKLQRTLSRSFEIILGRREMVERTNTEVAPKPQTSDIALQRKDLKQSVQSKPKHVLRIATVDNFQGEEAKVVIISLVRSNMMKSVGFLKTTNRINVLLSRAKHGMYIIGNADTYAHIPMWSKILSMFKEADAIGPAFSLCCPRHQDTTMLAFQPDDFKFYSPEGGCREMCNR